ncbi:MAG TPA: MASE1 domain-containing protein [Gaiellaceae bacterium]|nr:MASE1 domain-containing protein [Gaiellaceae bacterium]
MTRQRYLLSLVLLAAAYLGLAKIGIELPAARGVITPVWAPTGIAIAALFLGGTRLWPAVAAGAFLANATSGADLPVAALIAVGNTLEAVVGSVLLRRLGLHPVLDRVRDVLALILAGCMLAPLVAATNGVTALWVAGDVSGADYGSRWLLWWIGDAMGALIVAPLVLVWSTRPDRRLPRARIVEGLAVLGLVAGLSCLVFLAGYWRYPHLLFPVLILATLRFGQIGAVTGSFAVTALAVAGAVDGSTPIAERSTTEVVQILEGLLGSVAISLLVLGAVLAERATADRRAAQAAAGLNEAQALAHLGSWTWDIVSDRVTWSDELYRIYGLEPGATEVSFEAYLDRVHPDDRTSVRKRVERAYADQKPFVFQHRLVLSDGAVRWSLARGRVVTDERGDPIRMVGTAQDITERKRLDELRDSILATVSHELRTPLTAILGFSLTLQERGEELDARLRKEIAGHLATQAKKLDRLLSDLLDLDRLRLGHTVPTFAETDLAHLVRHVAVGFDSDQRIQIDVVPVIVEADGPKLERVVENLIANALKHTPPDTQIRVWVRPDDGGALIGVDDRGRGVEPEDREAIFEAFRRGAVTHSPGTGIGLSLVSQFAALHGGRAWVEDGNAGGASFRVFLPSRQG